MRKFIFKTIFFFFPFFLIICVESFVSPVDFFTFRAWEALVVRKMKKILPGPFYPNMRIIKIEQGDLAPHSDFSVKREVEWYTDRYGYRKKNREEVRYKIVIIGDSMAAGGGLTQRAMLSEVLEERLGISVYPYAPRRVSNFLRDARFLRQPPDLVIFETAENQIVLLSPLTARQRVIKKEGSMEEFFRKTREAFWIQSLGIFLDRVYKSNMLNYFRALLRRKISTLALRCNYRAGSMLFFEGVAANRDMPKEQIKAHAHMIEDYCRAIQERGIRFIFVPIPNKENIYHNLLPDKKRPIYLDQLILEMKKRGIATVNLQEAFDREYQKNSTLLYLPDDTHWNDKGVQIAADLIVQLLKKEEKYFNR